MNASKERAQEARGALNVLGDPKAGSFARQAATSLITQFLDAAERKLPSEAAYTHDKNRKKVGAK